jgi:hypothetical protein
MESTRTPCRACAIIPVVLLVFLVFAAVALILGIKFLPRLDGFAKAAMPAVSAEILPPVQTSAANCCAASCCGAVAAMPAIVVNPPPILAALPFALVLLLFCLLLLLGAALLFAYLGTGASLAQLRVLFRMALALLPNLRLFIAALRNTAQGMDAGRQAADLIATSLRGAANGLGTAANTLEAVEIQANKWYLQQLGPNSPLHYVRRHQNPPPNPFTGVKTDLNNSKADLTTAGDDVANLGQAMTDSANALRDAANRLDALLS